MQVHTRTRACTHTRLAMGDTCLDLTRTPADNVSVKLPSPSPPPSLLRVGLKL